MKTIMKFKVVFGKIETVKIERETEQFVWENGQKRLKGGCYFDTFADAKAFIADECASEVRRFKHCLEAAERELQAAQALEEPT